MFGRLLNLLWTPVETRIGVCLHAYTHFSLYLVYRGRPDVQVYVAKSGSLSLVYRGRPDVKVYVAKTGSLSLPLIQRGDRIGTRLGM